MLRSPGAGSGYARHVKWLKRKVVSVEGGGGGRKEGGAILARKWHGLAVSKMTDKNDQLGVRGAASGASSTSGPCMPLAAR